MPRMMPVVFFALALLWPGNALMSGVEDQGERKVVFEEIGEFNNGGETNALHVVGGKAYVCEFDNGLEILDVRDPRNIKKLCQVTGDLAWIS